MSNNIILKFLDRRSWDDFPVGTKVYQYNGDYYTKVEHKKWTYSFTLEKTYPYPTSDWRYIELPFTKEQVQKSLVRLFGDNLMSKGLENCIHEEAKDLNNDMITCCKHCGGWFFI